MDAPHIADVPLPDWARGRVNLASPRMGTSVAAVSDEFFAPALRMLADGPALWKPGVYDENGKWMDGWESRRRRDGGHDWCILKLGVPGLVAGADFDTAHFTGNYPPSAALFGLSSLREPGVDAAWLPLIAPAALGPSAHHLVAARPQRAVNWLKLCLYPDGGMARLRVYGDVEPAWPVRSQQVELSALKQGGRVIAYNNAHYGDVGALLAEGRGTFMGDGWETRRRREPGNDWIIVALGAPGVIERIEIDTAHFKGNYPDRASVQAASVGWGQEADLPVQAMFWPEVLGESRLRADRIHRFEVKSGRPVSHVKLNIFPDGGVSRFRIFGKRL
jgi:allantoicase